MNRIFVKEIAIVILTVLVARIATADRADLVLNLTSLFPARSDWEKGEAYPPNKFMLIHADGSSISVQSFPPSEQLKQLSEKFLNKLPPAAFQTNTYAALRINKIGAANCIDLRDNESKEESQQCWLFGPREVFAINSAGPQRLLTTTIRKILKTLAQK